VRHAAWIALAVGCYSPTFEANTPCNTACPGDLVCLDHVCREPDYVPPFVDAAIDGSTTPGDVDGDGILNSADNCPSVANADQHDEDTDLYGDVCDPCPHLAGNLADTDGDKVGDACDPQPVIAKQVLRFFDPFTNDRTEWTHDPGVSRVGETLRMTGAGYTELKSSTGSLRIAFGGTLDAITPNGEHQVAIAWGFNASGSRYHYIEMYDDAGMNGGTFISKAIDNMYPSLSGLPYQGAMPLGAFSMRIDESVTLQQVALDSTRGGQQQLPLGAVTAGAPPLVASNLITFFVQNVDVRIRYVWIVETLP
jgi:hypothetical protein